MFTEPNTRFISFFKNLSRAFSFLILFIGLFVFSGWAFDISFLTRLHPALVPMTPNTSFCFILTAAALLIALSQPKTLFPSISSKFLSLTVCLVGTLTLLEYFFNVDIGIDRIFFSSQVMRVLKPFPGRMSPLSALNFVFCGAALLHLDKEARNGCRPAQILILIEGTISLLALLGYAYGISSLYRVGFYKPMALHTAFAFVLVCISLLLSRPDCGLMAMVSSDSEGGFMVRRLLLIIIGAPFVMGWLTLVGYKANIFDVSFGLSVLIVSIIVVFSFLVWGNALLLNHIEYLRRQAEEALIKSEERFHELIQNIPVGIFRNTPGDEGKFIMANPALARLFGYESLIELMGVPVAQLYEDPAKRKYFSDKLLSEGSIINEELSFKKKDGLVFWGAVTGKVVRDELDNIEYFDGMIEDITERKRIDQMKNDFVSLVSHQLKTPVAEIKGYIYNMLFGLTGELTPKQRQYLEEMQEINSKNFRLISDLLNLSRLERGVVTFDIKPVSLQEIIDNALIDYYEPAKQKGLQLNLEGLEQDILVMADKDKFVEAVSNVINNALKFTEAGSITLKVSKQDDSVILEVQDTGKGVAQDKLDKLFKRDQILDGGPRAGGGAGLGLYIGRNFMLGQNGDIAVRSLPGQGSTFVFKIPLARV